MIHKPVLTKEILEVLNLKPNENFVDCTIGQGGHAKLIFEKIGPAGRLLGIDADAKQIDNCKELLKDLKDRLILVNDSYASLEKIVEEKRFKPVNGILLDLGMSSWQLEESGKGFSFLKDEILDMRYDAENSLTAEKIINEWPQEKIEKILKEYGEEKFAKKIAQKIIEERTLRFRSGQAKIKSTFQLVEIIEKAVPKKFQQGKLHCATKTFQALRIAVNDELNNLGKVLPQAVSVLSSGGRLAVISFHSLEDRFVKNFFKNQEQGLKIPKSREAGQRPSTNAKYSVLRLLKKPATASSGEVKINPRSRSAKLRAIVKK